MSISSLFSAVAALFHRRVETTEETPPEQSESEAQSKMEHDESPIPKSLGNRSKSPDDSGDWFFLSA